MVLMIGNGKDDMMHDVERKIGSEQKIEQE